MNIWLTSPSMEDAHLKELLVKSYRNFSLVCERESRFLIIN